MQIEAPWYVIRVRNGLHNPDLRGCGLFFQPVMTVQRYNRRYRKVISYETPVFPGYAFVQTFNVSLVKRYFGHALIGFARSDSGNYLVMNDEEMGLLGRALVNQDQVVFKTGDEVRIKDSLLFDQEVGEVVSIMPDGNLKVSFGGNSLSIVETAHHSKVVHA